MKTAVFIISHERADRVETYDTLRKAGYTGKIYVVIDDKDIQTRQYQDRFGDDLLVFNKQYYIDKTDTVINDKKESSPVYSRNAVEEYATYYKLDAFSVMDDDVINLRYRWLDGDYVRSLAVKKNLDKILDAYYRYIIDCNILSTSFSNVMLYVGGIDNMRICKNREMYQIHIRNAKYHLDWKSVINNDTITELSYSRQGYFLWSLPFIVYDSPKMNTLPGGMKKVYDSLSEFQRAFMATIVLPNVCKPIVVNNHIVIGRNRLAAYPVVISGRYKK